MEMEFIAEIKVKASTDLRQRVRASLEETMRLADRQRNRSRQVTIMEKESDGRM